MINFHTIGRIVIGGLCGYIIGIGHELQFYDMTTAIAGCFVVSLILLATYPKDIN